MAETSAELGTLLIGIVCPHAAIGEAKPKNCTS